MATVKLIAYYKPGSFMRAALDIQIQHTQKQQIYANYVSQASVI